MEKDGLIELSNNNIKVKDKGKLLIHNICRVIDACLSKSETRFSRTI